MVTLLPGTHEYTWLARLVLEIQPQSRCGPTVVVGHAENTSAPAGATMRAGSAAATHPSAPPPGASNGRSIMCRLSFAAFMTLKTPPPGQTNESDGFLVPQV